MEEVVTLSTGPAILAGAFFGLFAGLIGCFSKRVAQRFGIRGFAVRLVGAIVGFAVGAGFARLLPNHTFGVVAACAVVGALMPAVDWGRWLRDNPENDTPPAGTAKSPGA